jgi:hypothetical protein
LAFGDPVRRHRAPRASNSSATTKRANPSGAAGGQRQADPAAPAELMAERSVETQPGTGAPVGRHVDQGFVEECAHRARSASASPVPQLQGLHHVRRSWRRLARLISTPGRP